MITSDMLVSVIIPAYNTEKYINRCLDSVCGQTYKSLEIIVINDGSTDKTPSIIKSYAQKDGRIVFVDLQQNIGNGKGRNLAIRKAMGDYICFVDSDDYVSSDMVECLVKKAQETSCPDIVLFGHQKLLERDGRLRKISEPLLPCLNGKETQEQLQTCYFFGYKKIGAQPWLYFINRQYIFNNEIFFDESGHFFEDVIFTTKLIFCVNHIEQVAKPFYTYIIRKGSIMSNRSKKRIESWIYVTQQLRNFLKEKGLFDRVKDAYTVFFVNCTFLLPYSDYAEMVERDKEIETFLYDLSQTDVVKTFYYTDFKIPYVEGLNKDERKMFKKIKRSTLVLSSYFWPILRLNRGLIKLKRFFSGDSL